MNREKSNCIIVLILLSIVFVCTLLFSIFAGSSQTANQTNNTNDISLSSKLDASKKTVLVLATGGTIAGSGEEGKETGYTSGTLSVDSMIKSVPKIEEIANIRTEQIANINSDDIDDQIWLRLARRINEIDKDISIDGIVITHGTDTMEETAYFLNLVVKTNKPVVITGSMRPSTALSADGPMNLYQSVLVAADDKSWDKPVMAVLNDNIMNSRVFQKTSTSSVDAMKTSDIGLLGVVRDNHVLYLNDVDDATFKLKTEFSIDGVDKLPKISIVYFHVDADIDILKNAINNSDGVVIAGAGAGEYSKKFKEVIESSSKPIVVSSRVNNGLILQESILSQKTIASSYLNPQKAAVLLRVALMKDKPSQEKLEEFFLYKY